MQDLVVERAAIWSGEPVLASDVTLKVPWRDEQAHERPLMVLRCGPLLTEPGQAYDQRVWDNVVAAVSKNLPTQVERSVESEAALTFNELFVTCLVDGTMDAVGPRGSSTDWGGLLDESDVIAHVRMKDPKKAKAYAEAIASWHAGDCEMFPDGVWVGSVFVKAEYLKAGKLPRCIFNSEQHEVVLAHMVILLFEGWLKSARPTFKGLTQSERAKPFEEAAAILGTDMHVVLLDGEAFDGNKVKDDFDQFASLLSLLALLRPHAPLNAFLRREGVKARVLGGKLRSMEARLPSGVSFTSCINAVDTMKVAYVLCTLVLRLSPTDWIVLPEGDDNALCLRLTAWLRVKEQLAEAVTRTGVLTRKRLKIEGEGPWINGSLPHVGSLMGCYNGVGYAFHSWSRMCLKATVCVGSVEDIAQAAGMIVARADALVDRYDGCPVGWRLANHVRCLADTLMSKAHRSAEEEYAYGVYKTHKRWASPPDDETRAAYAVVVRVPVWKQELLEDSIEFATRHGQWCVDLCHVVAM